MKNNNQPSSSIRLFSDKNATLLLLSLLLADCFFVLLDIGHGTIRFFGHYRYDISHDGGLAEIFQYIKWLVILCLLFRIARTRQSASYGAWFAFILYFLLDDSLQIHERVGGHIAGILPFAAPLGLRQQDIGEMVVVAIAGTFLFAGTIYTFFKGDAQFKRVSVDMLLFIIAIAIFGIVIDIACYLSFVGPRLEEVLLVVDDVGEMVIASGILWYVFYISLSPDRPRVSLVKSLFTKSSFYSNQRS